MKKIFFCFILVFSLFLSGCTSNDYDNPSSYKNTYCCKYCSTGKACGDSCISRSYTCHKGPGCACDK